MLYTKKHIFTTFRRLLYSLILTDPWANYSNLEASSWVCVLCTSTDIIHVDMFKGTENPTDPSTHPNVHACSLLYRLIFF